MKKSIDIILDGDEDLFTRLFSYSEGLQNSNLTSLQTFMAHFFNQTLERDGYFGAWAMVWKIGDQFNLKLSSPHHDLRIYREKIPAFLEAGKLGLQIYEQNESAIQKVIQDTGKEMRFILPWGLSLARPRSIQLLHFPPIETFVYLDYLFSPTNRRWENLLGYNRFSRTRFSLLESIVDFVPLGAPGGDNEGIDHFNGTFADYVRKMLNARLSDLGNGVTQPVVGYGGPVMEWLQQTFPDRVKGTLNPLSLIYLNLKEGKSCTTPVLCANHPSKYLYYADKPDSSEKRQILVQDLVAAGWQAHMARYPFQNPEALLQNLINFWTDNPRLKKIMVQEDQEYSFNP